MKGKMEDASIRYNSLLDWSTWLLVGFVEAVCLFPLMFEGDSMVQIAILLVAVLFLAFMIVCFKGIYYVIDGNNLVIYEFFRPTSLPIDKIESVVPTKSILSAPATSIVNRLSVKFSDRKVLKSSMPLLISPAHQKEFIAHLLAVNPQIVTTLPT